MNAEQIKNEYLAKYLEEGEQKFYNFILFVAINKIVLMERGLYKGTYPDLECLECYNRFLTLFRREGEENYLYIAKIFRKAAHKVYRILLKKELTVPNVKFLNAV